MKVEHEPAYFKKEVNPYDGMSYYVYNGKYFEEDRIK